MSGTTYTAQVEPLTPNLDALQALMADQAPSVILDASGSPIVPDLDIDRDLYAAVDATGGFVFVTLRDAAATLRGAALVLVKPAPRHRTILSALTDVFMVVPSAAAADGADVLFDATKAALLARGVQRWIMGERLDVPHCLPLGQMGTPVEVAWALPMGNAA